MGKDASAVGPAGTPIRVRVQGRSKKPFPGVTVEVVGLRERVTNKDGLVEYLLAEEEFDQVGGKVTIRTRKFHCGPDPGRQKVVPGGIEVQVTLVKNKGFPAGAAGLETDAKGEVLVQVLRWTPDSISPTSTPISPCGI